MRDEPDGPERCCVESFLGLDRGSTANSEAAIAQRGSFLPGCRAGLLVVHWMAYDHEAFRAHLPEVEGFIGSFRFDAAHDNPR